DSTLALAVAHRGMREQLEDVILAAQLGASADVAHRSGGGEGVELVEASSGLATTVGVSCGCGQCDLLGVLFHGVSCGIAALVASVAGVPCIFSGASAG